MSKALLFPILSTLALLVGCAVLQSDIVQLDHYADCPGQTAASLAATQSQLTPLSDTASLVCALTTLRNSPESALRRSSLGSRLCLYLAEREINPEKREQLAAEGVGFAETALALGGLDDGVVHYYLATNLGLAIRDHIVLAMDNLGRLESEMKRAMELTPDVDDGGPLRILGMLYLKAPAWPNGIGDRDKALELLEKAVKTHPGHPLNHLFYAQALWDLGEQATLTQAKAEFALGAQLLAAGDWGYSQQPWKQEFDDFRQECRLAGCEF